MLGQQFESSRVLHPADGGIISPAGFSGLLQQFHDKGLGSLVTSWVARAQNLSYFRRQIQNVLGSEQVKELAAKAGIRPCSRSHAGRSYCLC